MITVFLATVIGWYLVITSLFLLTRYEYARSIVDELFVQRGVLFVLAIFTIVMGLLMVASHNIWVMGWPVSITIFAWIVLISGIARLYCIDSAIRIGRTFFNKPMQVRAIAITALVFGLFLLFKVYGMDYFYA